MQRPTHVALNRASYLYNVTPQQQGYEYAEAEGVGIPPQDYEGYLHIAPGYGYAEPEGINYLDIAPNQPPAAEPVDYVGPYGYEDFESDDDLELDSGDEDNRFVMGLRELPQDKGYMEMAPDSEAIASMGARLVNLLEQNAATNQPKGLLEYESDSSTGSTSSASSGFRGLTTSLPSRTQSMRSTRRSSQRCPGEIDQLITTITYK